MHLTAPHCTSCMRCTSLHLSSKVLLRCTSLHLSSKFLIWNWPKCTTISTEVGRVLCLELKKRQRNVMHDTTYCQIHIVKHYLGTEFCAWLFKICSFKLASISLSFLKLLDVSKTPAVASSSGLGVSHVFEMFRNDFSTSDHECRDDQVFSWVASISWADNLT